MSLCFCHVSSNICWLLKREKNIYEFWDIYGKTFKKPRCPYEKERLDAELKLVGEYGFRCKRELWRKNPQRIFTGKALLRRMNRYGLLHESQNKLNYVLALIVENFLECRLQTLVFKSGMAKSIQHTRVLIRQRHIRYELTVLWFLCRFLQ
ncbi:hypothetical protein UlMin_021413 [Ulmus minor]